MAKRAKKSEAASGRESTLKPELPEVSPEEQASRFKVMQQVAQDLHDVERRLEKRNIEKLELKGKLDKVSDDVKSLDARANALRRECVEVLEGRSTGRLPFGPGVSAEKPVTVDDLKTTPAELASAHYPDLLNDIAQGKEPSVTKAITIPHSDNRHVLVDDDSGHFRLLTLHTPGWMAPSSSPELPGVTGKIVDFMEAKLVIGTADESPLVLVELPGGKKPKKGAGGREDPGGATRGSAIERAKGELGQAVNALLMELRVAGHLDQPTSEKQADLDGLALIAALGNHENPRRWLNVATLDELNALTSNVEAAGRAQWTDIAESVQGRLLAGIPAANLDDFEEEGTHTVDDDDAPEGDEASQDEAGGPAEDEDDPEGVEEGGTPQNASQGRGKQKRGGRPKGGAVKKAKKAKKSR